MIDKYSFGIGDRFAKQGAAQLRPFVALQKQGIQVTPVWNKSHREHTTIGSGPQDVRAEADAAVAAVGWEGAYCVDADHINMDTVDGFIAPSDFFTLDVANWIGNAVSAADVETFVTQHRGLVGEHVLDAQLPTINLTESTLQAAAEKYLAAIQEAGKIYRHILAAREGLPFVVEVSMDETDTAQPPDELLCILAGLGAEEIPLHTIAPRFSGRFNKGVDYVGDPAEFEAEFAADVGVMRLAVKLFGLPEILKLSVHSGSDKFAIYPGICRTLKTLDAGLHIKTAGTTWLAELIGLAESGVDGVTLVRDVYRAARSRMDELCAPYAEVIDITPANLPDVETVDGWDGPMLARAIRHDAACADYNPDLRQLMHLAYKIAAEMGDRYTDALDSAAEAVGREVEENIARHINTLFGNS